MKKLGGLLVGLILVACSSETRGTGGFACSDISGNYSVTVERVSGSCDPKLDSQTASISMRKDGETWVAVLPGISGGCPGTLTESTCKFSSSCEVKDGSGNKTATSTLEYTFTATGYTGSTVNALLPPVVTTACDVTYRETGKKL